MIPKTIHYCWFGRGEFSPEIKMCIDSWKRYCPEYKIKEWNEDNSPMHIPWIRDAYKHGRYAFVADYVRFYALHKEGGIYMDTDMLLRNNLDELLSHKFFVGRQDELSVGFGIIGSIASYNLLNTFLNYYDSHKFEIISPPIITHVADVLLRKYGFQEKDAFQELKDGIILYPVECFYPIHYTEEFELHDIEKYCTENTIGVHLWNKTWKSEFTYLAEENYSMGFKLTLNRIKKTPFLPFRYYMKLFKYTLYYIFKK